MTAASDIRDQSTTVLLQRDQRPAIPESSMSHSATSWRLSVFATSLVDCSKKYQRHCWPVGRRLQNRRLRVRFCRNFARVGIVNTSSPMAVVARVSRFSWLELVVARRDRLGGWRRFLSSGDGYASKTVSLTRFGEIANIPFLDSRVVLCSVKSASRFLVPAT